jgi:hypothetical protein
MSSAFLGMLRYAWLGDQGALRDVLGLVEQRVKKAHPAEPEDTTQDVLWKIAGSREKAELLAHKLAERIPALEAALAGVDRGQLPALDGDLLERCDQQLSGYVSRMILNAKIDGWKKKRRRGGGETALPADDVLHRPGPLLDDEEERSKLGSMLVDRIQQDEGRPPTFDEAFGQIVALWEGKKTMEGLIAACVAGDETLRALAPEAARVRARNRLQTQHKRAREHLLASVREAVATGALTGEEGVRAEDWVKSLRRRQNPKRGASGEKRP